MPAITQQEQQLHHAERGRHLARHMATTLCVRSLVMHDPGINVVTSYRILVAVGTVGEIVVVAVRVGERRR